jgi:hypothetical protein
MKKIILSVVCVFAAASYAAAEVMPQFIITDCGTTHQIPSNSTEDEAVAWLDFWAAMDC